MKQILGIIKFFLFGEKIYVKIGKPICFPKIKAEKISEKTAQRRADIVSEKIKELVSSLKN